MTIDPNMNAMQVLTFFCLAGFAWYVGKILCYELYNTIEMVISPKERNKKDD